MSQLVKLLRNAGRVATRPTAGFAARAQEQPKKRLVVIAALDSVDVEAAKRAVNAGADVVEIPLDAAGVNESIKTFAEQAGVPVGGVFSGSMPAEFDRSALEGKGLDYVKVEAGDVPASLLLLEDVAVVLEVRESFTETLLKTLNFVPAKAIQVDAPENVEGFTVRELMEKRVDRELIRKPLLMKVGAGIKPEAAQVLSLVAPNALVVPAEAVGAWNEAVMKLKDLEEEEEEGGPISLKAPAAANGR